VQVETRPLAELTADRAGQRARLLAQAWPGSDPGHDPALDPLSLLLVDDSLVLASLDILSKTIRHRDRDYRASGLSAVVTERGQRHHGYGSVLIKTARLSMHNRRRDLALFSCDSYLGQFYRDGGFELLPGSVLIGGTEQSPLRSDSLDKLCFGAFFSTHAAAHRSDFIEAEIALYPGDIDRLW